MEREMASQDIIDAVPDDTPTPTVPAPTITTVPSVTQSLDSGIGDDGDSAVRSAVSEHSEEAYRMGRRRGKLVLICNTRFDPRLKLNDRKGTERDIDAIKRVFGNRLHFEVQECSQLKAHEMQREIANAAKDPGNKDSDCFAVFLLSHGSDSGKVYGTDQEILISKLMEPLKQNKHLAGKPKIVFVQACRGKQYDAGMKMSADDGTGSSEVTLPVEADFLYVYSTADGYVSFQNPSNGSWFVQTLCSELERNWHRLEMMQMLTRVCRALAYNYKSYTPSNPATDKLKQISSVTTTLTKAIRFHQP